MTTTRVIGSGYPPELVTKLRESTEAAALAAAEWFGRRDKNAADEAAVAAMRAVLATAPFDGTVVIGEGEKDAAPMLANGERLGVGGPAVDIAVDPLDGTRLVAEGLPGSICVIAIAPAGTMLARNDVFYMDKIVAGAAAHGILDLRNSVADNVSALSAALGKTRAELVVVVLDKPRHSALLADLTAAGVTQRLVGEGDISAAVAAADPDGDVDLVLGIGGTPEGIVAACAVRALGGFMQGRLAPQTAGEPRDGSDRILELDDLVASDAVLFVSTPTAR
ncbi:MAG TPA: fructose-bisphosphatase class II [Galbitalea sp.]